MLVYHQLTNRIVVYDFAKEIVTMRIQVIGVPCIIIPSTRSRTLENKRRRGATEERGYASLGGQSVKM